MGNSDHSTAQVLMNLLTIEYYNRLNSRIKHIFFDYSYSYITLVKH